MAYTIRPFAEDDAPALAAITGAAIRAVGSARYGPDQVAAWAARHPGPERFLRRWRDGACIALACDPSGQPVAYVLLEYGDEDGGHLDMLYCHPDHTRKGLADRLLGEADTRARERGNTRLYTEASELARPAFERAGYHVKHRRDFEIGHEGRDVPIHNYAMEKRLD